MRKRTRKHWKLSKGNIRNVFQHLYSESRKATSGKNRLNKARNLHHEEIIKKNPCLNCFFEMFHQTLTPSLLPFPVCARSWCTNLLRCSVLRRFQLQLALTCAVRCSRGLMFGIFKCLEIFLTIFNLSGGAPATRKLHINSQFENLTTF